MVGVSLLEIRLHEQLRQTVRFEIENPNVHTETCGCGGH